MMEDLKYETAELFVVTKIFISNLHCVHILVTIELFCKHLYCNFIHISVGNDSILFIQCVEQSVTYFVIFLLNLSLYSLHDIPVYDYVQYNYILVYFIPIVCLIKTEYFVLTIALWPIQTQHTYMFRSQKLNFRKLYNGCSKSNLS